jgi:hypothetical protein
VNERVQELTKIKNDLKRNEAIVQEQTHTIQIILSERDNLNNLIHTLSKEKVRKKIESYIIKINKTLKKRGVLKFTLFNTMDEKTFSFKKIIFFKKSPMPSGL